MFSLGKKLTILIVLLAITLSGATILFGYKTYKDSMEQHFITLGENLARTTAMLVNGEKIDEYLETLTIDDEYEETLRLMRLLKEENHIEYLYVVKPFTDGVYYIFDTDESEEQCELGYFEEWYEAFAPQVRKFVQGEYIAPVISNESFGWLLSVYAPVYKTNGEVAGYVGADFNMNSVVGDRQDFLWGLVLLTLGITVIFAAIYLFVVQRIIVSPINKMAKAADEFLIGQTEYGINTDSSLAGLVVKTNDEISSLANAMKSMEIKINEYIFNLDIVTKKAETDVLTGVLNREAFQIRVTSFLAGPESKNYLHGFIMVDIDKFKTINDTYGHAAGDKVIRNCAEALKNLFRSADDIVRMGGDEFAVFCRFAGDIEMIEKKAERLCKELREMRISEAPDYVITLSIGIALSPNDGETYQELYEKADEALYKSKTSGRDRYSVYGRYTDES